MFYTLLVKENLFFVFIFDFIFSWLKRKVNDFDAELRYRKNDYFQFKGMLMQIWKSPHMFVFK